MAITVFKRHEKKFLLNESQMYLMLPVIMDHMIPDKYCKDGKTYTICNLYFDTEEFDVIRNSLKKPFYKEKLRMRSYGFPEDGSSPVFLELKKKINGIVTKRRAKLTYQQAVYFLHGGRIPEGASYMTRQVLREIGYYLDHHDVSPTMMITYDRMAFFERENRAFRLTFDQNLRCYEGEDAFERRSEGRLLLPEHARVMEVKVEQAYPKWFTDLLGREKIYQSSFSKYGVAYKSYLKENVIDDPDRVSILSSI